MTIRRYIRGFDKISEALMEEIPIPTEVPLIELQRQFNEKTSNPMYDCYPINPNQVSWIEKLIGQKIHPEKNDYFLESDEA